MKNSLPKSIAIEVDVPDLAPGLVGLVQAVAAVMRHQEAEADPQELICISGAAFSNYVFDPAFNQHEEEPREYSVLAEYFSNYGPWESIAYYTGWEVLEVNNLPPGEVLKLAAFELASGRPFITLDDALRPQVVSEYQISVDDRRLCTTAGTVIDLSEKIQGDSEVFDNWVLLVRPGESPQWAASAVRQRINVLRWAVEHALNHREFFQETRENYAPGLAGVKRFREFLDGLTDPDGVEYAEQYLARLGAARAAAGSVLGDWAEPIAEALQRPGVATHLTDAAEHFHTVADALSSYDTMVDAFAVVDEAEREAIDALARAALHFPQAFEAL